MDRKFANKMMQGCLKVISYIMIVLAIYSFYDKIFLTTNIIDIWTIIMLIMEVLTIISFGYSYYLFYKKKEHATLFILLPLTIFFLYLTSITSYQYPIATFGTLTCIIMLLTIDIKTKKKIIVVASVSGVFSTIFILQVFEVIPVEVIDSIMTLADRLVLIIVVMIFFGLIGLSLYIYHINSFSKGSLEKLLKQYEDVLSFAKEKYNYTERETETARCLIQGMTNAEIMARLDISSSTVKSHVKHVLDKAGIDSRVNYYMVLLDRYIPL